MNTTHNALELFERSVKQSLSLSVFLFLFAFVSFLFCSFFKNRKEEQQYIATRGEL